MFSKKLLGTGTILLFLAGCSGSNGTVPETGSESTNTESTNTESTNTESTNTESIVLDTDVNSSPLGNQDPLQGSISTASGSLLLRGPLQAQSPGLLTVMGQMVSFDESTRVIGGTLEALDVGSVLSIFGERRQGVIHSVAIVIETQPLPHIVVGVASTDSDQASFGALTLDLSNASNVMNITIANQALVFEGQYQEADSQFLVTHISPLLSGNVLSLQGASACGAAGDTNLYNVLLLESDSNLRTMSRDVSTEVSVSPSDTLITLDSVSERGIGLRFVEQGIGRVDFQLSDDSSSRYFAALDRNTSRPVVLEMQLGDDQCVYAYFPDDSSCAIAVGSGSSEVGSGTGELNSSDSVSVTNSVSISVSSDSSTGNSVVVSNGNIRFGQDIRIENCEVQSTGGVPVINISR